MKLRGVVVGLLLSSLVLVACGRETSPGATSAKVPVPSVAQNVKRAAPEQVNSR